MTRRDSSNPNQLISICPSHRRYSKKKEAAPSRSESTTRDVTILEWCFPYIFSALEGVVLPQKRGEKMTWYIDHSGDKKSQLQEARDCGFDLKNTDIFNATEFDKAEKYIPTTSRLAYTVYAGMRNHLYLSTPLRSWAGVMRVFTKYGWLLLDEKMDFREVHELLKEVSMLSFNDPKALELAQKEITSPFPKLQSVRKSGSLYHWVAGVLSTAKHAIQIEHQQDLVAASCVAMLIESPYTQPAHSKDRYRKYLSDFQKSIDDRKVELQALLDG